MAIRFYIVPKSGDGLTHDTGWQPKYFTRGPLKIAAQDRIQWADYGHHDCGLVAADVTPTEHAAIAANPDVIAVPANIDLTIGANLALVQSELETLFNIPAGWITGAMTYRTVLRWIWGSCQLMQRFDFVGGVFFVSGLTLDLQVGDLPTLTLQRLKLSAQMLGADTSSISLLTSIRAAFRIIVDQLPLSRTFLGVPL